MTRPSFLIFRQIVDLSIFSSLAAAERFQLFLDRASLITKKHGDGV